MNFQFDNRAVHIRELKTELERVKAENARLHNENAALNGHLDLAILAACDLAELGTDGKLVIVDGWNLILGAKKEAKDRDDLVSKAMEYLKEHREDRVWIVLDCHDFASEVRGGGRLRITYTGGTGEHRADKMICDYVRMAHFRADVGRIEVKTNDKDFAKEIKRLKDTHGTKHNLE